MSDYIGITEAQSNPFAPLTSELVKQLRDNPIAIAEGAEGAPRVEADAMQGSVAGDILLFSALGGDNTLTLGRNESILVPGSIFRATTSCQIRVSGEVRVSSGSEGGATLTLFKNGTSVQSRQSTGTGFVAMAATDITLVAGDVVHFTLDTADVINQTGICRRLRYFTGGQRSVGGL